MSKQFVPIDSLSSKSKPETARSQQMRVLLEQFPGSGLRAVDFCLQNGVSLWQFWYWRKRLGFRFRKRGRNSISFKPPACTQPAEFVRLGVADTAMRPFQGWGFEVNFPNGIIFRGTEDLALKSLDRIRRFGR